MRDETTSCADRLKGLRSKTVTLELELTILKAQRATDHATIGDLRRDVCIWQGSLQDLGTRYQRLSEDLQHLQAANESMKMYYQEMNPELTNLDVDIIHGRTLACELTPSRAFTAFGWCRMFLEFASC